MTRGGDSISYDTLFNVPQPGERTSARHLCTQLRSGAVFKLSGPCPCHTRSIQGLVGEMVFTRNNDNTG
jgi:hypothetical protein